MTQQETWQEKQKRTIWATDSCPRAQYYRVSGEKSLPQHFVSFRGSVMHSITEEYFTGKPVDFRAFPEAADKAIDSLLIPIENFHRWVETTEIDLKDAECEVKFEMDLPGGYRMVRKIDLLTPEVIIDFKTRSYGRGLRKGDRTAMIYSRDAVRHAGEGGRDIVMVYLGGKQATEVWPFKDNKKALDKAEMEAAEQVDRNIQIRKMIAEGVIPSPDKWCKYGAFCGYRDKCRGEP